jgi:hypothetical protein
MRSIDKFILHVVHNLFPLNEYKEGEINRLMAQFKAEAEDLNIQVSDEQLKKYIERFDRLKDSPKVTEKDLRKYSLSKLIKIVTASPGAELDNEDEEDSTPDMVYREGDITIWNGAKQGNCITYGANQPMQGGSRWCITQPGGSYFGRYRYGSDYRYPTFYLAKNDALPDSDKLSFVALQVLDNGQYKFTNRANNPGMEGPFSWDELNRRIPWLSSIPNLKNILKYIPFSKSEKESEVFKNNPISIKQWMKEPFSTKKQYLLIRAGTSQLFSDISNDLFISKYLPQYPQIATVIAGTTGIIDVERLIPQLDKFSKQDQISIAKQIRNKFKLSIFNQDIPFDLKKFLVKTDKIGLESNQRIYVTKDNQSIVLLTLGDDIKVGLYTEDDEYPNIKLNQRTSKYLLDYPELDRIPLKNLLKLAEDEVVSKEFVNNILDKAKKDPNSALIVKPVDGGEIILDSNSFSSYKMDENGKITKIPFDSEEVQQILNDSKDNEGLQNSVIGVLLDLQNIPETIDRDGLLSVVKAIPYSKRITPDGRIVMVTDDPNISMFSLDPNSINNLRPSYTWGDVNGNWRRRGSGDYIDSIPAWQSYFAYLRSINRSYNGNELQRILKIDAGRRGIAAKKAFIRANPPITDDSIYRPVMNGDTALLINLQDPRSSFKVSDSTGKLNQANVPASLARQLTGQGQPAAGQVAAQVGGVARRGRPAGQPNAPQPAAPAAAGNVNVGASMQAAGIMNGFMDLPRPILRRLNVNNATSIPAANNRGASRRQNILGGAGRVTRVTEIGPSTIYYITLANGVTVASAVVQPGNGHYIITPQSAYQLESPSDLLQALQQRNLAEIHQYLVNEYMERNPEQLTEFKELLRKHINEKKNANK